MKSINPKVQQAIDNLAPDMIPLVKEIESGMETTQGHYGKYMQLLSTLAPDSNKVMLFVISHALLVAGANAQGVKSALRIITGSV